VRFLSITRQKSSYVTGNLDCEAFNYARTPREKYVYDMIDVHYIIILVFYPNKNYNCIDFIIILKRPLSTIKKNRKIQSHAIEYINYQYYYYVTM